MMFGVKIYATQSENFIRTGGRSFQNLEKMRHIQNLVKHLKWSVLRK